MHISIDAQFVYAEILTYYISERYMMQQPNFINNWRWTAEMANHLRFPFKGQDFIFENFSQAFQDIFISMVLRGKVNGKYLEIGGRNPIENNNTYLVHRQFNWSGLTIEFDPVHYPSWQKYRPDSNLLIADALAIDYTEALKIYFGENSRRIDYLQLDIDPSINTLGALKILPLDMWRFSVITFETDAYQGDFRARDESREILSSHGYVPIAKDVSVLYKPVSDIPIPFEDWWVDPLIIDKTIIESLKKVCVEYGVPQHILFSHKTKNHEQ